MAKTKRSILMLLACVFLFSVAALIFTACSTPSYTVTFLVQNDATGEWEQYATETSEEGVVTLPNNPTKTDYVFRNWYDNTDFTGDPFTGENVEGDMNVYAYFVPTEISINVTKSEDDVDEDTVYVRDLETLKEQYEAEALAANLTFDGWYTGADYDTLWTSSSDVDVVYGRFMAQIMYDNGYETYEPLTVQAGTTISEPTLEYIQKSYMDDEDIYYVVGDDYAVYDDNGTLTGYNEVDFTQPVTQNMTIKVLWKTPYLTYAENANGTYSVNGTDTITIFMNPEIRDYLESLPVVSFPSRISETVDGGNNVERTVESVHLASLDSNYFTSVQKVIVNEGIRWVYGINNSTTLEEISLPTSLKGIERGLNNLTNISSIILPEGIEVIINSLWYSNVTATYNTEFLAYDFMISIPSSVQNMAMVPVKNMSFTDDSPFFIEDNALYLQKDDEDLVLINSFNVVDGELHVKDGVTGIQVGAFFYNKNVDYVYLPSTFTYMNKNALHSDYKYALSRGSGSNPASYLDCTGFTSGSVAETQNNAGVMLYNNLGADEIQTFIFETSSYPETLEENAFCDGTTAWTVYTNNHYVVFIGEVSEGDITVSVVATNNSVSNTISFSWSIPSGSTLTFDAIIEQLTKNEKTDSVEITSVMSLSEEFSLPVQVASNIYLDIEYVYTEPGFTFEIVDGEAVVTGLDITNAIQLSSGYYYVNITSTVTDNGMEYPVTSIADEAFMGDPVQIVLISNSVTTIGNSAFENCTYLTSVSIEAGGLETIGAHAFEDTGFTSIVLPLSKVTYIGPYAFKSETLQYFIPADGETYLSRDSSTAESTTLEVGKYYISDGLSGMASDAYKGFIIKYTGKSTEMVATYSDRENATSEVTVYDVQLIAIAGGCNRTRLTLGASIRTYKGANYVYRYEIMEGSVYYLSYSRMTQIVFGIVSKVHTNAFTDIDEKFYVSSEGKYTGKVNRYEATSSTYDVYDSWLTVEQITSISSVDYDFRAEDAIFEDGWFNGITVENENYETLMAFMSEVYVGTFTNYLSFQ